MSYILHGPRRVYRKTYDIRMWSRYIYKQTSEVVILCR